MIFLLFFLLRDGRAMFARLMNLVPMEPVRRAVEVLLTRQPGVANATAVLTAHITETPKPAIEQRPEIGREVNGIELQRNAVRECTRVSNLGQVDEPSTPRAGEFQPGDELYAIPRHICPSVALHKQVYVVSQGHLVDRWDVVARDRWLTI